MSSVRAYYDSNTWKFMLLGSEKVIHRELWAPGITRKRDAVHYAHALVVAEVRDLVPDGRARILDLRCGVGAASQFIAERIPAEVIGVSISPVQIAHARRWLDRRHRPLVGRCTFREADFCALPADVVGVDLAFAIEAFVHAQDTAAFFREVARALRPGGRLIVIDDVLTAEVPDPKGESLLHDMRSGWHIGSLVTEPHAAALAAAHGLHLVRSVDLSPGSACSARAIAWSTPPSRFCAGARATAPIANHSSGGTGAKPPIWRGSCNIACGCSTASDK
jgi:SAM-dependent methyltransferase